MGAHPSSGDATLGPMMKPGDEDDAKDGAAADDDPDGVGLTIPVPSMVKPWNPPKPNAPPKTTPTDGPDATEEPKDE